MPIRHCLGLDLGGTSVKAVAVAPDGSLLASDKEAFDLEEHLGFLAAVRRLVGRLDRRLGSVAEAIGLSAPGLASADGRSIAFMPGRFPGLVGLDWAQVLGRRRLPVLNDAHAALLGEVWQGAAAGSTNVVLLTLGTGVGGAAMVDGHLLTGHHGKAGHLGHMSLNPEGPCGITGIPGSLEDAVGNHNIAERTAGRFPTTHTLVKAYESGDAQAAAVWLKSLQALAAAIATLTNVLDPEVVILGGGIAGCGESLFGPVREWVDRWEWKVGGNPVRIVPARLGDLAGAFGAARNAQLAEGETSG